MISPSALLNVFQSFVKSGKAVELCVPQMTLGDLLKKIFFLDIVFTLLFPQSYEKELNG